MYMNVHDIKHLKLLSIKFIVEYQLHGTLLRPTFPFFYSIATSCNLQMDVQQ